MDIQELIEAIDKIDKPLLVYITKETYALVQEAGNNRITPLSDIHNVLYDKEDAMAALFDADIFGWSIKAVNWCNSSCNNGIPWLMELDITLFKTN